MAEQITARQREVLDVVQEHAERTGVAPSLSELANVLKIRRASAQQHLKALERKGYLLLLPGRARGIRLLQRDREHAAACREIPVLGRIAAGVPLLAVENAAGTIHIDAARFPPGQLFALTVHGDSMIGAGILNGDLVIVRPQSIAEPGEIVVALIRGEEATVKRFRPHGKEVQLESENEQYDPIVCHAHDVDIRGKVVGVHRAVVQ